MRLAPHALGTHAPQCASTLFKTKITYNVASCLRRSGRGRDLYAEASSGIMRLAVHTQCGCGFDTLLWHKAKGGGLSFLPANQLSSLKEKNSAAGLPSTLLVYVNGDHEYVLFDPYSKEQQEFTVSHKRDEAQLEETGRLGYTSIYGELPEFNPQKTSRATIVPAQRPWETIFNGPSHALPPLTKLCSEFLESLLEKRTTATG